MEYFLLIIGMVSTSASIMFAMNKNIPLYRGIAIALPLLILAVSSIPGWHAWVTHNAEYLVPVILIQAIYGFSTVALTTALGLNILVRLALSCTIPLTIAIHTVFFFDEVYAILIALTTAIMCTKIYAAIDTVEDQYLENISRAS